jgi:hypothetical protein
VSVLDQADAEWEAFREANRPPEPDAGYATMFTPGQMRAGHAAHWYAKRAGQPISGEVMALERAYNAWRHRVQRERGRSS